MPDLLLQPYLLLPKFSYGLYVIKTVEWGGEILKGQLGQVWVMKHILLT